MSEDRLSYASAGVDINEQARAISLFKDAVKSTYTKQVLSDVGSFGGLFSAQFAEMSDPVLVSSIDGVGTKTKLAQLLGKYDGLGADIVNHCVNDILVQGARPIFFLDYFAASRMNAEIAAAFVKGAAEACKANGCALIGGELAEMPDVYAAGECDIVGCVVGVVDRERILPKNVRAGDAVLGLPSDGLHTNGFSLARKALFEQGGFQAADSIGALGETIGEALIRPHRSYLHEVMPLLGANKINALAHITGGGLVDNVPRVMPEGLMAQIDYGSWTPPPIFDLIRSAGNISDEEMRRSFNMGIGMVIVSSVPEDVQSQLPTAHMIGTVVSK